MISANIVASRDTDREAIKHTFDREMHDKQMEYYAESADGIVWTNTDNSDPEYYKAAQAHYLYQSSGFFETSLEDSTGWLSANSYYVAENNIARLYLKMQDEAYANMERRWTEEKKNADSAVNQAAVGCW